MLSDHPTKNMLTRKLKLLKGKFTTSLKLKRFYCSDNDSNPQILSKYLGVYNMKARNYVRAHRLSNIEPETLIRTIMFCKELGFDNHSILENPVLLRAQANTLDQYYTVMNEGGFKDITPSKLGKFRTLYRKNISTLKEVNLIDPQTDVAASFIKHLNPCPENFSVKTNGDADVWSKVHAQVLAEYLKWRLKATDADIEKLVRTHRGICRKSFKYLCENIAMAEELGFTPEKMLKYGYVLHAYPKYTKEILEKYPVISGSCMKKAMRMYPKLFNIVPMNIEKIKNILKENNITDEAIRKRINIFQLSPETLKLRLEETKRIADLKVLFHNPNILKIIIHHNRARSRLSFLKELQLKCTGVSVLGNDNQKFNVHVREGRDLNTQTDIYAFLQGILKKDIGQLQSKLRKHPYHMQVPLISMEDTYNYLQSENFEPDEIFNVVYILLYPREKVCESFKQVRLFEKEGGRHLTQINKLNLAMYFIEREHHFTGDGVWTKEELDEEGNL